MGEELKQVYWKKSLHPCLEVVVEAVVVLMMLVCSAELVLMEVKTLTWSGLRTT